MATVTQAQNNVQCNGNVDLVFVLDASASLSDAQLEANYNFAKDIYTTVKVGVEGSGEYTLLFGAIPYASSVYEEVLDLTSSPEEVASFLQEPSRNEGILTSGNVGTQTGKAMKEALTMITNPTSRPTAHKVIILVTDGEPDNKQELYDALNDMEDADIEVIVVAIGSNYDLNFLSRTDAKIHLSADLPESFIVADNACEGTVDVTPSLDVGSVNIPMDVVFILDESYGSEGYFNSQKQFVKLIMNTFGMSSDNAIVSVFKYGESVLLDGAHFISRSTSAENLDTQMNQLSHNVLNDDERNLYPAFNHLKSIITDYGMASRPVIVVLVMSGISGDSTAAINEALKFHLMMNPNVYLLVVGAGPSSMEWENQMKVMAYDDPKLWFHTANYAGLAGTTEESLNMVGEVRQRIYELATGNFVPTNRGPQKWSANVMVDFMVDGSAAMLHMPHYAIVKRVLQDLVESFNIPPALVSVSLYDDAGVYDTIGYDVNFNHEQFIYQLNNKLSLLRRTANADPNKGLDGILSHYDQNSREGYHTLAYLITMSSTSNQILTGAYARALALRGIQLMVIAMGDAVNPNDIQLFGGPAYQTSIQTIAMPATLQQFKLDLYQYATDESLRRTAQYYPWNDEIDFIFVIDTELARSNKGVPVKQMLIDHKNRFSNDVRMGVVLVGDAVLTGENQKIDLNVAYENLFGKIITLDMTPSGGPDILAGLNEATNMFAAYPRDVPKMVMLWFDGAIGVDMDLILKANAMRAAGIAVFAHGFGPYADPAEIHNLAFHPEVGYNIESVPMTYTPQMDHNVIAVARGEFEPSTVQDIVVLEDKCNDEAGIIVLIDVSASMGDYFNHVLDTLAVLISGFNNVDFGFTLFSTIVQENKIALGQYSTYADNYLHLLDLEMDSNFLQTGTSQAILDAISQFASIEKYTVVDGAEKVVLLITDGLSVNPTATVNAANEAWDAGITMLGLSVGASNNIDELTDIVRDSPHNLFSITGGGSLDITMLLALQGRLCQIIRPGVCSAGNYFTSTSECTPCDIGYYQPEIDQTSCIKCAGDSTTVATASTADTDCIVTCGPGQYLMVQCELCPENFYKAESGFDQCTACPTERPITKGTGSTSIDNCIADTICGIPLNLMMVIDASASIAPANFNILKMTLIGLMDNFGSGTRVAVATIGSETIYSEVSEFIPIEDTSAIYSQIQSLESGAMMTNTASALKVTGQKVLADSSPSTPTVYLVITDGRSVNPLGTAFEAAILRLYGFKIVALGVGEEYFTDELIAIASEPESQYVLRHSNYMELLSLDISGTICAAADDWIPYVPPVAGICEIPVAIVFVVDLSLSVSTADITIFKSILHTFVQWLSIENSGWGVGLIFYDGTIIDSRPISYIETEVLTNIQDISTSGTSVGTYTHLAIDEGKALLEAARDTNRKMMMVFSDGSSTFTEDTKVAADDAKAAGIEIVAMGPDDTSSTSAAELSYISSSGQFNQIDGGYLSVSPTQLTTATDCLTSTKCHQPIQVVFIWYINDADLKSKTAQLTQDLSNMMSVPNAGLVEVRSDTSIDTVDKALAEAGKMMTGNDVVRVFVVITNQGADQADRAVAEYWRDQGVVLAFVTSDTQDDWEPYASSDTSSNKLVFTNFDFADDLVTTKVLWSICIAPCESGSQIYSDGVCDECPEGFFRDKADSYQCVECAPDRKTDGTGKTSSIDCRLIEDECLTGYEKKPDDSCSPCPKNTGRDQFIQTECTECPPGFFTLFIGSSLQDCLPPCGIGEYWSYDTDRCEKCESGTFGDGTNQFECEKCPGEEGFMVTVDETGSIVDGATGQSQCVGKCEIGSFWDRDLDDPECVLCPENKYQDDTNQDFCLNCLPGTTTSTRDNPLGSTSLTDCEEPCPAGQTWDFDNNICVPCGVDKYRGDDNICKDCPAGLTTANEVNPETATSLDQCKPECADDGGEYFNSDKQKCFKCEPSKYQPSSSAFFCIDCPKLGWTSPTGSTSISDCEPPCGMGEGWNDDNNQCEPCWFGSYQNEEKQEDCKPCGNDETTQFLGSTDISQCIGSCSQGEWKCADDTCLPGSDRCDNEDDCPVGDTSDEVGCDCSPGQYYDMEEAKACVDCDPGSFQEFSGQVACIACSHGRTTPSSGSTSRNDCIDICADGYKHIGDRTDVECEICAIGSYREQNVDDPRECQSCSPPFSTRLQGSADPEACISVCNEEGEYYDVDIGSCTECAVGSYQSETENEYRCNKCPPGQSTLATGAADAAQCEVVCPPGKELPILGTVEADCVDCLPGYYRSSSMTLCERCPNGYTSDEGNDSQFDCYLDCPEGYEFNDDWTECQMCKFGSYKPSKATPEEPFCELCGVGKSTTTRVSTSPSACIDVCNSGLGLSEDKTVCTKCPQGTYREQFEEDECTSCPTGYSTSTDAATSSSQCTILACPPGHKVNNVDNPTTCLPCGFDFYKGPSDQECQPCPDEKHTYTREATSVTQCYVTCPAGDFLNEATGVCVACPYHEYQDEPGKRQCKACPKPNYHTNMIDRTDVKHCKADWCDAGKKLVGGHPEDGGICVNCGYGYYRGDDDPECLPCPNGGYTLIDNAITADACQDDPCKSGYEYRHNKCGICKKGFYRTKGSSSGLCVACPAGKTTRKKGATGVDKCTPKIVDPCNAGFESIHGHCVPCQYGFYKTERNRLMCEGCPQDSTTLMRGSTSAVDCIVPPLCPEPGQQVLGGTCVDCEIGFYIETEVDGRCVPCPDGSTTLATAAASPTQCVPICSRKFDMIIAVDLTIPSCGYVRNLRYWLKELVNRLDVHTNNVRIGIVLYGKSTSTLVSLHSGTSSERLCSRLSQLLKCSPNYKANTALALEHADHMFQYQSRPGCDKVMLLMTANPNACFDKASAAASRLSNRNIDVAVISTTDGNLASDGSMQFVIPDYSALPSVDEVIGTICSRDIVEPEEKPGK